MDTPQKTIGNVLTTITVINRADHTRSEDGTIKSEDLCSVTLENVLVDTGATTRCNLLIFT